EGGEVDPRSDLFSLGSLIYEMLTGRAPFRGATPTASLKQVLTATPPPLSREIADLPSGLSDLVDRLLAKDRGLRPARARDVALTLSWLESRASASRVTESVSALPTHPVPVMKSAPVAVTASAASSPPRRRSWRGPAASVLTLALVAGGAFYAVRGGP